MDLHSRARIALDGFMCGNPEKVPDGHRTYFGLVPFPEPRAEHIQWDDGDGTARALDAWLYLRRITGDYQTGREIEAGQWRYLCSLLHPQTGLAYVADLSAPDGEGTYYHLWDQGRTLRHLVNRHEWPFTSDHERIQIESLIVSMIKGLKDLSATRRLGDGTLAVYWTHEAYFDDRPASKSTDYGFTIGSAQMLEPATRWAEITGSEEDQEWAVQLGNGFVAGLERRRESTTPMFGASGEFYGHFHCAASGLVGLVYLARNLIARKKEAVGRAFLDTAVKAYSWIFSEANPNRGSSHGWFPESSAKWQSNLSEICCTADMIELAFALASAAESVAGYEKLDACWDDVDRFCRNELFQMQLLNPEKLEPWLDPKTPESHEAFCAVAERYAGGWPFGHTWPHDLMDLDKDAHPGPIGLEGSVEHPRMPIGGCCMYSGPRGLFACWEASVKQGEREVDIRFPLQYAHGVLAMDEIPSGGLSYAVHEPRSVCVRIPSKVDGRTVHVLEKDRERSFAYDAQSNRVRIDSQPGEKYKVVWDDPAWESLETLGSPNDGHVPDVPVGSRITYKLQFHGNQLKELTPCEEACLPYGSGL
ncbi:MAG: hypothetical protein V1800_08085 [Candidatus Latescibacterota bacterium]